MAELENIINSVMSSPESMEKIMDIVKMFGGGDEHKEETPPPPSPVQNISGAGGMDPALISKIMELVGSYSDDGDKRIKLLSAIRPYLKAEDGFHIDRAIQIVKLSRVAKSALHDFLK